MAKRVAIVQSNYIPWKGYFNLIAAVDEFILLDDVQYTRRDWRNRNRIRTSEGTRWLTIPVYTKGKFSQRIAEARVASSDWAQRHWLLIQQHYKRSPHFKAYAHELEALFQIAAKEESLSEINFLILRRICHWLGIQTKISKSCEYGVSAKDASERLVKLCIASGATVYVTGPSAKKYLRETTFQEQGIEIEYFKYPRNPHYQQLHSDFIHEVSVIDMLLNVGKSSAEYFRMASG